MSKDVVTKTCRTCKETKQLSEFYKRQISNDGLDTYCKICRLKKEKRYYQTKQGKASRKRYYQSEKGQVSQKRSFDNYKKQNPEKIAAKDAVRNAIACGKLLHPNFLQCHYCLNRAEQYHHPSYELENWLKVEPVCRKCHRTVIHCSDPLTP